MGNIRKTAQKAKAAIKREIKSITKVKGFAVYKGRSGGLSSKEITEVIAVMEKARARRILPAMTVKYNKAVVVFGRDPLAAYPKTGDPRRVAVKVRALLRTAFGTKYSVGLI